MGAPRYRAADPATLIADPLGTLTALFDRRSAQTHLVAEPVPQILAALSGEALDADALLAKLSQDHQVDGDIATIDARLAELVAVGLIEAL